MKTAGVVSTLRLTLQETAGHGIEKVYRASRYYYVACGGKLI